MNKLNLIILKLLIIFSITTPCFAERIISTQYFHDIAIQEVDNHDVGPPTRMERKVIIYKTTTPNLSDIKTAMMTTTQPTPKLGEIVWTITPQILPANEKTCLKENIDTCEEVKIVDSSFTGCFNSCIQYGPTVLAFDEKNQKLYLLANTIQVGQGGGPLLGFVADLKTKTIKYLKVFSGFVDGTISPDGKHILLNSRKTFKIYNVGINQTKSIEKQTVQNIRWIDNNKFSYEIANESKNAYRQVIRNI